MVKACSNSVGLRVKTPLLQVVSSLDGTKVYVADLAASSRADDSSDEGMRGVIYAVPTPGGGATGKELQRVNERRCREHRGEQQEHHGVGHHDPADPRREPGFLDI